MRKSSYLQLLARILRYHHLLLLAVLATTILFEFPETIVVGHSGNDGLLTFVVTYLANFGVLNFYFVPCMLTDLVTYYYNWEAFPVVAAGTLANNLQI